MPGDNRIIVLCEDKAQEYFVRKILEGFGVGNREMNFRITPSNAGAGDNAVIKAFPSELDYWMRRKNLGKSNILIAVLDADVIGVDQKIKLLRKELNDQPYPDTDGVGVFNPARNLESWIHFLTGEVIDEKTDYKKNHPKIQNHLTDIKSFAQKCRERQKIENMPPSLAAACAEFEKIRVRL
jgi:hypothetical protein